MKTIFYIPVLGMLLLSTVASVHSETGHSEESHDQEKRQKSHDEHASDESHESHDQEKRQKSHDEHASDESHESHEENEEGVIKLSPEQQKTIGVVVEPLGKQELVAEVQAPGEVKLNAYNTVKVTTRISAQVVKRHAGLGEQVKTGQPLVTLSGVDMAEAQGALMVADQEWRRVKNLGAKVTSNRRYTKARVARQLAYAKVNAYGMTPQSIDAFLKSGDARKANGEFQLLAPRDGTIADEEFIEGALIEPGHVLFTVTDETTLWVEARLTPQQSADIHQNATARVKTNAGWLTGNVSQLFHTLDENTRTIAVRITVPNPGDVLHPGEFVDVYLQGEQHASVLAVPETAVVRSSDGDWQVFIEEHENEFRAVEVKVLESNSGYTRIEGIKPGTRVVTKGTFFLQSELAKSGFDIHNH